MSERPKITEELIEEIRNWLTQDGIEFFRAVMRDHGTLLAVLDGGKIDGVRIPHPVHFREGMQVRNKLRQLTNFSWTVHQYDDFWTEIVERAIK